jgi:uncharacterized protein
VKATKPRIDFITLAVGDLGRSLEFYRDGLDLPTKGVVGAEFHDDVTGADGTIAFVELQDGLIVGLYERANLAKDASIDDASASSVEFGLGHLVGSKEEVDSLLARAQQAGATVTRPPHERPWGVYSGYFTDPDGHLWEVAWNPRQADRSS